MRKRLIFLLLSLFFISSCNRTMSLEGNQKTNYSFNIPFKYIFTGFVVVKNISDLPIGTVIVRTEQEWNEFIKEHEFYFEIPNPKYTNSQIDFNKQNVIYYGLLDAKADIKATAWKINNISINKDNQLSIEPGEIDNLFIDSINDKNTIHRYIIFITVDKKYIPDNIKSYSY